MIPERGEQGSARIATGDGVRRAQFAGFLVTAVVLGSSTFRSMMWGIWGAPVYPTHYIALLGAFGVFVGAFLSLWQPERGRLVALVGLAGLGTLWVPGVVALVPEPGIHASPWAYSIFLLYFVALGFGLLYPKRWKWSLPALVATLALAVAFAGVVTASRVRDGELVSPSFASFRWTRAEGGLVVDDPRGWIDAETRSSLERAGIRGRLEWTASSGERSSSHRIILLVQAQPPGAFELHYPRGEVLVYAYDGVQWRMIPDDAETFPASATIEPQDSATILWQDTGGGRQGTLAFTW